MLAMFFGTQCSLGWCWSKGSDALQRGRYLQVLWKVMTAYRLEPGLWFMATWLPRDRD